MAHRQRQVGAAAEARHRAVMRFVGGHALENRAALVILRGQAPQMVVQVRFHLPLRLGDEAEALRIADAGGEQADAEASRVPERREHARAAAELVEPRRAPREMVAFFSRRGTQLCARCARACEQRLTAVEALCGELARMIYAQQGGA